MISESSPLFLLLFAKILGIGIISLKDTSDKDDISNADAPESPSVGTVPSQLALSHRIDVVSTSGSYVFPMSMVGCMWKLNQRRLYNVEMT